jgi:1-acyl-sn-glycerol-3-phosphate acyltransferase
MEKKRKAGLSVIYAVSFFLLSLAGAVGLPLLCSFSLWWGIPIFLGLELLLHALFVTLNWLPVRKVDREKPLERQLPGGMEGVRRIDSLLCAYGGLIPRLTGLDKLPKTPYLLVCNHRSFYDPLMILHFLREENIAFVSKPSNLAIPMIGDIAYAAGFLPIDRENDRNALRTILTAADYLKRGLCSMGIFPEGTRSRTGKMGEFHPGSFKIAQRAGVPVVIACVQDTEKASRRLFLRPTRVYLDILEVLPAERVKAMSTRDLADYSKGKMLEVLKE